jgi:hypothetical protein
MADAASAAAGAEHASAGLPQFDLGQWPGQMVWMLIVFGVMLLLFARVFVPKVGGTIAAREDKIGGDIGQARRLRDEAEAQAKAAAEELAQARARAQKLAAVTSYSATGTSVNSAPLRRIDRPVPKNRFFSSCCVRVDPPRMRRLPCISSSAAISIACQSNPWCW